MSWSNSRFLSILFSSTCLDALKVTNHERKFPFGKSELSTCNNNKIWNNYEMQIRILFCFLLSHTIHYCSMFWQRWLCCWSRPRRLWWLDMQLKKTYAQNPLSSHKNQSNPFLLRKCSFLSPPTDSGRCYGMQRTILKYFRPSKVEHSIWEFLFWETRRDLLWVDR